MSITRPAVCSLEPPESNRPSPSKTLWVPFRCRAFLMKFPHSSSADGAGVSDRPGDEIDPPAQRSRNRSAPHHATARGSRGGALEPSGSWPSSSLHGAQTNLASSSPTECSALLAIELAQRFLEAAPRAGLGLAHSQIVTRRKWQRPPRGRCRHATQRSRRTPRRWRLERLRSSQAKLGRVRQGDPRIRFRPQSQSLEFEPGPLRR